ncbi:MAG: type II secretion system protein GspL [Ramlibacter sp.]
MPSIVVLLPPASITASTELVYLLTPDGRQAGVHASASAALLPQPAGAGAEIVAIAPAAALSWHQVELPRGTSAGSPRLRAVLQGLLEERLLDEPEALHFALQPAHRASGTVWVAVCDRAWLRSAVQVLEAAQRPITRIVPEFAPEGVTSLFALGDPEQAQLVVTGPEGVALLPLAGTSLALLPAVDDNTPLMAEPAVAALAEQVLQHKVELQQAPQRWLRAAQSEWDLAQSEFASSGRARTFKKLAGGWAQMLRAPQWRPARWAVAAMVALNLLGLNAWAWKESAVLQAKRETVRNTLTQTFPQVKVVVDAPVQMEKEVAALRLATGGSSGRDLEAMLGALATVAPEQPVTGLEFSGTTLRARGVANSPDQAGNLAMRLRGLGYAAAMQGDTLVLTAEAGP